MLKDKFFKKFLSFWLKRKIIEKELFGSKKELTLKKGKYLKSLKDLRY